jgi:hypothetical protein
MAPPVAAVSPKKRGLRRPRRPAERAARRCRRW